MASPRAPSRGGAADLVGAGLVIITSLQFGGVVVLGKIVTDSGLPIASFLAVRFAAAAVLLAVAIALIRLPLRAARGEGWRLAFLGVAGYAVEATLFFSALRHGTTAAVTLLFFTYPVFVSLIAFLSGRGFPGWMLGAALAFAVSGAALVVVTGHGVQVDGAGVAFALGSSFAFALYLVGADVVLKETNSLAGAMWVSGSAAGGLAAYALVSGAARLPHGWHQWGPVLGTAAFTAGAFFCLFAGLRRLGAVRTSIVAATEPLAASALAAMFLHQTVTGGIAVGGALILVGAVTASLARRGQPAEPPVP
jgi:drug/metabolite transporter (DMT)-like permease